MLIDLRTYTLKIGAVRDFLELYAAEGLAVQTAHLGPPLGYCTTEVGELTQGGAPLMSFGLMGGSLQAQGHLQVTVRVADHGQNPQAASDAPRWRFMDDNQTVAVEWNFPQEAIDGFV